MKQPQWYDTWSDRLAYIYSGLADWHRELYTNEMNWKFSWYAGLFHLEAWCHLAVGRLFNWSACP